MDMETRRAQFKRRIQFVVIQNLSIEDKVEQITKVCEDSTYMELFHSKEVSKNAYLNRTRN